jgi:hypothetical protein
MASAFAAVMQQQKRIVWMYKTKESSEETAWTLYLDVETAMIEEAFQNKKKEALLDDCCINLKDLVQIPKSDSNNQSNIRRVLQEGKGSVRQQRFMPDPILPSRPFLKRIDGWKPFLKAIEQHFFLPSRAFVLGDEFTRRMVVEKAAEGLVVEAMKAGKQRQGEWMAEQLLKVKEETREEIYAICARLYTMDSFLYKKMNEFMRLHGDKERANLVKDIVPTFGPFAYLLDRLIPQNYKKITVYRGAQLTDDLIEQYRQFVGQKEDLVFPAFTSTSRNQEVAEFYAGNVLFTMDCGTGADVSQYSQYSDEEEVLLSPNLFFRVRSCTFDNIKTKWIIDMAESI